MAGRIHLDKSRAGSERLINELHNYRDVWLAPFTTSEVLVASPYYHPGMLAKTLHRERGLPANFAREVAGQRTLDDAFWIDLEKRCGLPSNAPLCVFSVRSIRNNSDLVFSEAYFGQEMMNRISTIATIDSGSAPGKLKSPHLQGTFGSCKTMAVMAYAALCGKPIVIIPCSANPEVAYSQLITGSTVAKTDSREDVMRANAEYGIFANGKSKFEYFRACQGLVASGAASDIEEAHFLLEKDDLARIADLDGMLDEKSSIATKNYGLLKRALMIPGGAVILVDEFTKLRDESQSEVAKYIDQHEKEGGINSIIVLTSNPANSDFRGRFPVSDELRNRLYYIDSPAMTSDEYRNIFLRVFGYNFTGFANDSLRHLSDDVRKKAQMSGLPIGGSEVDTSLEIVEKLISANQSLPKEKKEDFLKKLSLKDIGTSSPPISYKSAVSISQALGDFLFTVIDKTRRGGDLSVADVKGDNSDTQKFSLRQIADFRTRFNANIASLPGTPPNQSTNATLESIQKRGEISPSSVEASWRITPEQMADAIVDALDHVFVKPLSIDPPNAESQTVISQGGVTQATPSEIIKKMLELNGLTRSSLESNISFLSPLEEDVPFHVAHFFEGVVGSARSTRDSGLTSFASSANDAGLFWDPASIFATPIHCSLTSVIYTSGGLKPAGSAVFFPSGALPGQAFAYDAGRHFSIFMPNDSLAVLPVKDSVGQKSFIFCSKDSKGEVGVLFFNSEEGLSRVLGCTLQDPLIPRKTITVPNSVPFLSYGGVAFRCDPGNGVVQGKLSSSDIARLKPLPERMETARLFSKALLRQSGAPVSNYPQFPVHPSRNPKSPTL